MKRPVLKDFASYVSRQLLPLRRERGLVGVKSSDAATSVSEDAGVKPEAEDVNEYSAPDVALDALQAIIKCGANDVLRWFLTERRLHVTPASSKL